MNEQLQAKLLEYLNSGEAFVKTQAPEYVNQALTFYAWDANLDLTVSIISLILGIFLSCFSLGLASWRRDAEGRALICGIAGILFFLTGAIGTTGNYSTLKKIELAPKVFLVEKLTRGNCK